MVPVSTAGLRTGAPKRPRKHPRFHGDPDTGARSAARSPSPPCLPAYRPTRARQLAWRPSATAPTRFGLAARKAGRPRRPHGRIDAVLAGSAGGSGTRRRLRATPPPAADGRSAVRPAGRAVVTGQPWRRPGHCGGLAGLRGGSGRGDLRRPARWSGSDFGQPRRAAHDVRAGRTDRPARRPGHEGAADRLRVGRAGRLRAADPLPALGSAAWRDLCRPHATAELGRFDRPGPAVADLVERCPRGHPRAGVAGSAGPNRSGRRERLRRTVRRAWPAAGGRLWCASGRFGSR